MATETVISDHTSTDEVEKKVEEEVETVQRVIVCPSKETEEGKPKPEASLSPEAPARSADKEGDGRIVPSLIIREIVNTEDSLVVDELVKPVEQEMLSSEEKTKAAELQVLEFPSPEAEEKLGDKQIEPPPTIIEADSPVVDKEVKPVEQETLLSLKETGEEKSKVEEVKTDEQETISACKETEEEKPKAAESQNLESPSPEAEEKVEDKQIEPSPVIKEAEKADGSPVLDDVVKLVEQDTFSSVKEPEEEKPKAAESQSLEAPSSEVEEKTEDKQIEPSPVIEVLEKTGNVSVSDEVKTIEKEITIFPSKETEEEPRAGEAASSGLEEKKVDEKIESSPDIKELEEGGETPVSGEEVKIVEQEALSQCKETKEEKSKDEEVKTAEQEIVSLSKENDEEKLKDAESPSPEAPSEEKMVGLQADTSSIIKEFENTLKTPVLDVTVEDNSPAAKESFPDAELPSAPEPVVQPVIESVEKQPDEKMKIAASPESSVEAFKEREEPLEAVLVKESEAVVKETEGSEIGSIKVGIQNPAVPEMEVGEKREEESEATEKVVATAPEIELEENKEIELAKDKETLASEIEDATVLGEETKKDQGPFPCASADEPVLINQDAQTDPTRDGGESSLPHVSEKEVMMVEQIKEQEAKNVETEAKNEEHVTTKELMQPETVQVEDVSSSISNAEVAEKLFEHKSVKTEEDKKDNVISEMSTQTKTNTDEVASSFIATTEVTEKFFEGENTSRDVELISENKSVKTEEDKKDNVISEMSTQTKTNTDDVTSSFIATTEVTEKLFEGENTSRDVELISENKKGEALSSVETDKDGKEEKLDEVTTADIVKQTTETSETELEMKGESQENELELKAEETAKANTDDLGKEQEVNEAANSDVPLESAKDCVDEKTPEDLSKQEVSTKQAHKQSNNILSKVKQSLVKAKKAITGKSSKSTQRNIKISST